MLGVSLFCVFVSVLSSFAYSKCEHDSNCGSFVKSTCRKGLPSKWNYNDVGFHLKMWFKQIKIRASMKNVRKKHLYSRMKVEHHDFKIVRYIGNVNCTSKNSTGPTWRTAGTISNNQYYDGFLYGQEDEKGKFSGMNLHL